MFVENVHHGRPIAKFILNEPLRLRHYETSVIELPAPKIGKTYQRGLEHFEMTVGKTFEEFRKKFHSLWMGQDNSGPYNQTVFIALKSGFTIKFHERTILEVLKLEGHTFTSIYN